MAFKPSRDDVMRREVARFAAENGLVGRAARQGAQQAIIDRLGGGAATARALGYTRGPKGSRELKDYKAAQRAFERARTGQQELRAGKYLSGLERLAAPAERARLDRAETSRAREQIVWPEGAAVRVTVEAEYSYSGDDRDRSDLWGEIGGDELDRLTSAPWEAWQERLGEMVGGGGQPWGQGDASGRGGMLDALTAVHGVRISWVSRGAAGRGYETF